MNLIKSTIFASTLTFLSSNTPAQPIKDLSEKTIEKVNKTCLITEPSEYTFEDPILRGLNENEYAMLSEKDKIICDIDDKITKTQYFYQAFIRYHLNQITNIEFTETDNDENKDPLVIEMNNYVKDFKEIGTLYETYINELNKVLKKSANY